MLWRGDQGEDRPGNESEKLNNNDTPSVVHDDKETSRELSREELLAASPEARAMYEKLQSLRTSVDSIKHQPEHEVKEAAPVKDVIESIEAESRAAEERLRERAEEEARRARQEAQEKALKEALRKKEIEEASRRAAAKKREAERLRLEAKEASRRATMASVAQSSDVEEMIALQSASRRAEDIEKEKQELLRKEKAEKDLNSYVSTEELTSLRDDLKGTKDSQNQTLDAIWGIAEDATMRLNQQQQEEIRRLTQAQEEAKAARDRQRRELKEELQRSRARRKAEEIAAIQAQQRKEKNNKKAAAARKEELRRHHREEEARLAAEKRARAVEAAIAKRARAEKEAQEKLARNLAAAKAKEERKARELAAKKAREAEEARIKEERKEKARQLWRERDAKRQEKRRKKLLEKQREQEQKKALRQEIARYRRAKKEAENERSRLKQIREDDAALGGGLVTVHDITIKTEINKRENIRLRDLLGIKTKEERNAATEEERMALRLEREYRREDARAKFSFNNMLSLRTWQNSRTGKAVARFGKFCDRHKTGLITTSAAIATVLVCSAAVFNYCTAFEYSYNGTALGIVDNKDDVLAVTELVEGAMSQENNMNVIIKADDITFKRVSIIGGADVDSTEDVLKRLTYMGDFKVASYGIYVDGVKIGAVQAKEDAKDVLQDIKDLYTSKAEESEVEEAVFLESVEVRRCSTKLENLHTEKDMLSVLTTDTDKETVHTVIAGETLENIVDEFGTSKAKVLRDNPGLPESGAIDAGTPVIIKEKAPPVTVKITEKIGYKETIRYTTETTKDDEMYEGDDVITQEGKNGRKEISARIVTVNGDTIETDILSEKVTKKPVTKKITVGTKERPPTVGDGNFSCPIHDRFHKTTGFQMRWGRFHKGVDLACPTGTPVYAADGGTVVTASYKPSYGNLVEIDHQNGYLTKYAHNSKIIVNVGDKVYEGQKIAEVGSTGNSTGPHCHFEVRDHDVPKNPLDFISLSQ